MLFPAFWASNHAICAMRPDLDLEIDVKTTSKPIKSNFNFVFFNLGKKVADVSDRSSRHSSSGRRCLLKALIKKIIMKRENACNVREKGREK